MIPLSLIYIIPTSDFVNNKIDKRDEDALENPLKPPNIEDYQDIFILQRRKIIFSRFQQEDIRITIIIMVI